MLSQSIANIKGIGDKKADLIKTELGVFSVYQLIQHFPFRYIDKTKYYRINELSSADIAVQIIGILRSKHTTGQGAKKRISAVFSDDTGTLELVWFKGLNWVQQLTTGKKYIIYGKISVFNGNINMVHPEISLYDPNKTQQQPSFEPVYPLTEKLKNKKIDSRALFNIMKNVFRKIHPHKDKIPENLPTYLIEHLKLLPRYLSWMYIHFPSNQKQLSLAKYRIKFEEFFFLQLRILKGKQLKKIAIRGFVFDVVGSFFNDFYNKHLHFELTNAQKRVIKEIRKDMGTGHQMNRLLQGDVGSGKTIVAFMTMLIALDNGFQNAMMAPTEILAQQHYESLSEMAKALGIRIELLTGNVKGKKREEILEALNEGAVDILVGTHALIEDPVIFKNLGLVIVDEQHRFGVVQRSKMWKKNEDRPPHILVMTATPIPRTLAMTVYGDLDVSVIDEMPPGRKPINTFHKFEHQRLWTLGLIKKEIEKGHQAYIVYPLIEESSYEGLSEVKDLMIGYEAMMREFPRPKYQISIVHGRQKPQDKQMEMDRFQRGETQILMATTVIEVGVNIPNASVMIIENAERFGLAQLHQLRGRVGRGGGDAYCVLMTDFKLSSDAKFRMETMVESTDGFKISEADLKLRGPGNLDGTQQSGILNFKLANIVEDAEILQTARIMAKEILNEDPDLSMPKNKALDDYLKSSQKMLGFGLIS